VCNEVRITVLGWLSNLLEDKLPGARSARESRSSYAMPLNRLGVFELVFFAVLFSRNDSYVHFVPNVYLVVWDVVFFSSMGTKLAKYHRSGIFYVDPGRKTPNSYDFNTSACLGYDLVLGNETLRLGQGYRIPHKVVREVVYLTSNIPPMLWYLAMRTLKYTTPIERK